MSRRVEITLVAASLLAMWLVFFAWPPVDPLAVFEAPRPETPASAPSLEVAGLSQPERASESPAATSAAQRSRRATSGDRVAVQLTRYPASDLVRVHGRVLKAGWPVDDLDLMFQVMGAAADDWAEWEFTDEDGAYEVFLTPGSYLVLNDDGGPWITNLVVPAGPTEHAFDIHLPAGIVRGRVVESETGGGVANATVVCRRALGGTSASDAITQGLMERGGEASSGEDGSFELVDLRPGEHVLVAKVEDVLTAPVRVVVTDAPIEGLLLTLGPGHTLTGVVRGPGGEPVSMELQILPGTQVISLAQLQLSGTSYSNYDGEFVVAGLRPGPHVVIGRGETRTHDYALHTVVDFRPGSGPVELLARRCGFLEITVLRPDGRPVSDVHVDLRPHHGGLVLASVEWLEASPVSDDEGRLVLDDVLPGWYRISAVGTNGRLGPALETEVRAEGTTRIELVLE